MTLEIAPIVVVGGGPVGLVAAGLPAAAADCPDVDLWYGQQVTAVEPDGLRAAVTVRPQAGDTYRRQMWIGDPMTWAAL
jgi:hypothetical protein